MSYLKDYWIKSNSAINSCSPEGEWWHVQATSLLEAIDIWVSSPFSFHDRNVVVEDSCKQNSEKIYGPDIGGEQGDIIAIKFIKARNLTRLNEIATQLRIACYNYPPSEARYDNIHQYEREMKQKFPWNECDVI